MSVRPGHYVCTCGGESDFVAFDQASLGAGAMPSALVSWSLAPPLLESGETDSALPYFRTVFDEFRRMGQLFGPSVVAQLCIAATSALRGMAHQAQPGHREVVLRLASRFAEYTGWMAQEAGSDAASLWWTEQAVQLAADGGDDELAAYALVRRAELALYTGDSVATVQLARRAGQQARSARIRGLAAQREAQGHALVGDRDACRRALDRGAELTSGAAPPGGVDPVLGSIHLPDLTAFVMRLVHARPRLPGRGGHPARRRSGRHSAGIPPGQGPIWRPARACTGECR